MIDGKNAVRINEGHDFYKKVYGPILSKGVVVEGLDDLLWALAEAENSTCNQATIENYEEMRYMVYTSVTIEGITHEMWLPVMDGNNKAMKAQPYTYTTRYGEKTVEAATMFDINKTIMRCLVKNLAMFGLGLYIYAGEDLPITEDNQKTVKADNEVEYAKARTRILKYVNSRNNVEACEKWICDKYKVNKSAELTYEQSLDFIKTMESKGEAI